jgi:hypothetical protein
MKQVHITKSSPGAGSIGDPVERLVDWAFVSNYDFLWCFTYGTRPSTGLTLVSILRFDNETIPKSLLDPSTFLVIVFAGRQCLAWAGFDALATVSADFFRLPFSIGEESIC